MATRTPARARDDARASPVSDETAGPPQPPDKGHRRYTYTAEFLAECRRRFEDTPESIASISRVCRISEQTVRRLAIKHGWVRYRRRPVDLSDDVKLLRRAETLAARQGDVAARASDDTSAAMADTLDGLLRAAQDQLADVRALRERMSGTPQSYSETNAITRALSNLTAVARELQRMQHAQGAAVSRSGVDDDDDMPTDIDEFRRDLAQRISAIMESWPDDEDGDEEDPQGPAAAAAPPADEA